MENLREQFNQPTLFSSCDVGSGVFSPEIDPIEARTTRAPCSPIAKDIISCRNPDKKTFLEEVDGLSFSTVKISQPSFDLFPSVIPVLDRSMFNLPGDLIRSKLVGISIEDVFSSAPVKRHGVQVQSPLVIRRDVLRSPALRGKGVILFSSGRDVHIEGLWREFHALEFAQVIKEMGFDAVTGINFSVFFGECPFGQALNLKKSLQSSKFFYEAGTVTIPHVYFAHELHLKRWLAWLKDNPSVGAISINCQFHRTDNTRLMEEGIIYLIEHAERNLTVILEGPQPKKMPTLFKRYPDSIVVAAKGICMSAAFHSQFQIRNGRICRINSPGVSVADILNTNVDAYAQYIRTLSK